MGRSAGGTTGEGRAPGGADSLFGALSRRGLPRCLGVESSDPDSDVAERVLDSSSSICAWVRANSALRC